MVLATGEPASDVLLTQLRTMDGILAVARVEL
jgi:hypothetical protein